MRDFEDPNDKTSPTEGTEPNDDLISDEDLDQVFGAGTYWSGDADGS